MSLPTFDSARDEIQGLFNEAWTANAPAANGGVLPAVQWQGVPLDPDAPPAPDEAYARVTVRHGPSRQRTFGTPGTRRFERPGVVTIQVFAPLSAGEGLSLGQDLAIIARDAYEGRSTDSGIWFRNARIQEIGPSGAWFQMNMVVEFQYDELR